MVFDVEVHVERIAVRTGHVHLHRMVDDQIHRNLRIHLLWIATHFHHGVAQSRQINDGRDPREVLKNHTRRAERNLASLAVRRPRRNRSDVLFGDEETVMTTQCAFEKNADGIREVTRWHTVGVKRIKRVVIAADAEGLPCVEGVQGRHGQPENSHIYEHNPSTLTVASTGLEVDRP